jgi:hypothetical protein
MPRNIRNNQRILYLISHIGWVALLVYLEGLVIPSMSHVTFYCYLGILEPLLSFHNIHSCHFRGTILSAPSILPGRNLDVFNTYFLLLTWGISCDVTINRPMSLVGFRAISRKLIVLCAHFRCSHQFD